MGIWGLSTYIKKKYKWKEIGRDAPAVRGPLVIDAIGTCYSLYEDNQTDWIHGGQYKEFEEKVVAFFTNLRNSSIEPIVVFDGVDYKREKGSVIFKRKKNAIKRISSSLLYGKNTGSVKPLFSKIVFLEVIKEMRISFIFADGDADALTASIANYHGCPVLSSDSDYYIFNLEAGYIPFEFFNWKTVPITGKIYNLSDFASTFCDPQLPLLIPALTGNDFIKDPEIRSDVIRKIIDGGERAQLRRGKVQMEELVMCIACFSSVDEFLSYLSTSCHAQQVDTVQENLRKAEDMYIVGKTNMEDLKKSTALTTANGAPLPQWILDLYRTGCFSIFLMDPLILNECMLPTIADNYKREDSSLKIGLTLRRRLYGILKPYLKSPEVNEGIRIGNDMQFKPVRMLAGETMHCHISDVPSMTDIERRNVLCTVFEVSPEVLDTFENKWQLIALSLYYWSRNVEGLVPQKIQSLVFSFVIFSCEMERAAICQSCFKVEGVRSNCWLENLHFFAMWQVVYYEAMKLNDVLNRPLLFSSPSLMFDGRLSMHYACMKEKSFDDIRSSKFAASPGLENLYEKLISICYVRDAVSGSSRKRKGKPAATVKQAVSKLTATTNRFAALTQSSDSDDDDDDEI